MFPTMKTAEMGEMLLEPNVPCDHRFIAYSCVTLPSFQHIPDKICVAFDVTPTVPRF